MGQKMDPNGLRLGIIKDWNSKWYADSKNFADYLVEDYKIRKYIEKKLHAAGISKVELNHKEVQETADRVAKSFKELVTKVVVNM